MTHRFEPSPINSENIYKVLDELITQSDIKRKEMIIWEQSITFTCYLIKGGEFDGRYFLKFGKYTYEQQQKYGLSRWTILPTVNEKMKRGVFAYPNTELNAPTGNNIYCDSYSPAVLPKNILMNHFPKFVKQAI